MLGSKSSMGLPEGSSRTCFPPTPLNNFVAEMNAMLSEQLDPVGYVGDFK